MSKETTPRGLTLVLPYYENPTMLVRQLEHLGALPEDIRRNLTLIVVDDGSPENPAPTIINQEVELGGLAEIKQFRIEVDVRWNWLAARNIGVHEGDGGWYLLTDIDHLLPEKTARRIIEGDLDPRNSYRFSRVDAPELTPYKPHPNSWLFTKKRFDAIGGYDERFSGYYGTDGEFRDRVAKNSREIVILDEPLIRVPREVIADASTTKYGRKEAQDGEGVTRIRKEIARQGGPTKRLSFPYHRVV